MDLLKNEAGWRLDRLLMCLAAVVLVVALALLLVNKTDEEDEEPVTLVFLQYWAPKMESGALESIITEFEAANPSIKIALRTAGEAEIVKEITDAAEAETARQAAANAAVPEKKSGLSGLFGKNKTNEEKLARQPVDIIAFDPCRAPRLIDAGALSEGGILPVAAFLRPLYYNINILSQAGFDRPPKTRTELLEMCRAVSALPMREVKIVPIAASSDFRDSLLPWLLCEGDEGFSAAEALGEENLADSAAFFKSLYDVSAFTPVPFLLDEEEVFKQFAAGHAALFTGDTGFIRRLRENREAPAFSITTLPARDDFIGKSAMSAGGWYCGITEESPHKEEAALFISALSAKRGFISKAAGAVPGDLSPSPDSASMSATSELDRDEVYAKARDIAQGARLFYDWELPGVDEALENLRRLIH
jgi:multiple sugar transport system substrate-binding protein